MLRAIGLCLLLLATAACATKQPYADDETIAAVSYRDPGDSSITLYTMINNRTGSGGHSSIVINASETVIFDPAGSFKADVVPERNDVLFGITPAVERAYRSSHARSTHHVLVQKMDVTPAQAETAYRLALANGPVPGAFCANATSSLLRRVPGLESIDTTFSPTKLADQFGAFPGVDSKRYYEDDSADLQEGLKKNNEALNRQAAGQNVLTD